MHVKADASCSTVKKADQEAVWFIITAMMIALFSPTSIGGVINPLLVVIGNVFALAVFLFAVWFYRLPIAIIIFIPALVIMCLLIAMTFLSPFIKFTPGAFMPYLTFALLCSVRIDRLQLNVSQKRFLLALSAIVALLCFLAFFRVSSVMDLQESYYQMYPDLYKFMMQWANKPVLMFATHSVAGFAYYLTALCLLAAYLSQVEMRHRWVLLLLSLIYSLILVLLLSNTGLALFLILFVVYSALFIRYGKPVVVILVLFSFTAAVLYFYQPILFVFDMASDLVLEVLTRKENGLLARFSSESRLGGSINYLTASPLVGVGMTSGADIAFGDSFYAEYMLRLSFFGYFLVAFVTYGYLYINTLAKRYFFTLATLVFIADLGYPLFVTYRFIFIFPVVVILLNTLSRQAKTYPELH